MPLSYRAATEIAQVHKITTFGTLQLPAWSSQEKVCLQSCTDLLLPVQIYFCLFFPFVGCSTFYTYVVDFFNAQLHAHFSFHYPEFKTSPCSVLPAPSWGGHTWLSCTSEKTATDQKVILSLPTYRSSPHAVPLPSSIFLSKDTHTINSGGGSSPPNTVSLLYAPIKLKTFLAGLSAEGGWNNVSCVADLPVSRTASFPGNQATKNDHGNS